MYKELERYFAPLKLTLDYLIILGIYLACVPIASLINEDALHLISDGRLAVFASPEFTKHWLSYLFLLLPLLFLPVFIRYGAKRFPRISLCVFQDEILKPSLFIGAFGLVLGILCGLIAALNHALVFLGLFVFISWPFLILHRILLLLYIKKETAPSNLVKNLLIVGTHAKALHIVDEIDRHPEWGLRVTGFLSLNKKEVGRRLCGHVVLGHLQDLGKRTKTDIVDCVLYDHHPENIIDINPIIRNCAIEGIEFAFTPNSLDLMSTRSNAEYFGVLSICFHSSVSVSPELMYFKRVLDIFLSFLAIILLIPVWILIPLLIKKDSKGSIFYVNERIGKNGRKFRMYKFRTMIENADTLLPRLQQLNEMDGPVFKIKNDPRITRVGKTLRTTSLDELPQLFNVLKGEMSLVGPRPPIYSEIIQYRPWERKRLSVTPGITGFWQVSGRNEVKFDEWIKLDLMYIEHFSIVLDLKILIRTIPAVLSRKGAH